MEMPWMVDLWFAWDAVRFRVPVAVVSISGKTLVNAGRVRRPPITPLSLSGFSALCSGC
jgi:hypothetical protein